MLHLRSFTLETPLELRRGTIVRVAWFPESEPFVIVMAVRPKRRGGSAYILHPSGACWTSTADLTPVAQVEPPRHAGHSRMIDEMAAAIQTHIATITQAPAEGA